MQVNGTVRRDIVREANDSLNALVNYERRSWGNSIVTLESCRLLVGVDLLAQWQDVDLIVVNWLVVDRVCHPPGRIR